MKNLFVFLILFFTSIVFGKESKLEKLSIKNENWQSVDLIQTTHKANLFKKNIDCTYSLILPIPTEAGIVWVEISITADSCEEIQDFIFD